MDIQNISGSDSIPSGFTVDKPKTETVQPEREEKTAVKAAPKEEGRGNNIDTYA
jgi:hypothetical protein